MMRAHDKELEKRKEEYDEKMEADALRYTELMNSKDEEAKQFNEKLNELYIHHNKILQDLQAEHKIELEQ